MYSPKISEDLIPLLYRRAKEENKPMTRLVNEILNNFLNGGNDNVKEVRSVMEEERRQ